MSAFEDCIINNYTNCDYSQFRVQFSNRKVFICGGAVPDGSLDASFRQRFVISISADDSIHFVLAETFKDYFKDNNYPDLLVFEDNIAQISSIILIFLESPGSLVELGMFITKPEFYKKLLIVVPSEEVQGQDSFIYLGPLEHIKRKYSDSVFTYPWPKAGSPYDFAHIKDLSSSLRDKLANQDASQKFNKENSAHVSFLIAEIIRLSYPIILDEIQYALMAMNIEIRESTVLRYLYLLKSLGYINTFEYSSYKYYYPSADYKDTQFLSWGKGKNGRGFDEKRFLFELRSSYILDENDSSKKRQSAIKQISLLLNK